MQTFIYCKVTLHVSGITAPIKKKKNTSPPVNILVCICSSCRQRKRPADTEGMSMSISRVRNLTAPMHLGPKAGPLCPMSNQGSPEALLKLQMAPRLIFWISLGSKKKEPRYACLSDAKASHSQRIWAEVSSIIPHFLHNGLSCRDTEGSRKYME